MRVIKFHMISSTNYKSVEIDIITYKKEKINKPKDMSNDERFDRCNQNQNMFVCSICLNKKSSKEDTSCCKKKSKLCPICQNINRIDNKIDNYQHVCRKEKNEKKRSKTDDLNGKNIQTSQPDVTRGLTLLNEVLTVFQTKKQTDMRKDSKTKSTILKDASTGTDRRRPELSVSRVFYYSIEEGNRNNNCKYTIINCQPETKSQFSINLTKQKSLSIPQMKLEELKNSFKQKTASKDAIEEVNRMFATVRKLDTNDSNRPMVHNGPRILPVVKTENISGHKLETNENKLATLTCNCTNFKMSSGDSIQCCHKINDGRFYAPCHHNHYFCANCERQFQHN